LKVNWNNEVTLPRYRVLYETGARVILLWGGRDAGKSYNLPYVLIKKCLRYPSFKCIAIRKTQATVNDSCISEINNAIDRHGLRPLFHSTKNPISIECRTGGRFIGRGLDEPSKIKSITQPSDAWIEEANEITEHDYDMIVTTLRNPKVPINIWLSFNPEVDGQGKHWIKDKFFEGRDIESLYNTTQFINQEVEIEGDIHVREILSVHTTYHDNIHAKLDNIILYESYKNHNVNKYNVWALGHWGAKEINRPFVYAFSEDKHVSELKLNRNEDIWLSFDFNVDPITCLVSQHYSDRLRVLREFRLRNSDIFELCQDILAWLPKQCYLKITGDASGNNRSANSRGHKSYFEIIKDELGVAWVAMMFPQSNPSIKNSRAETNKAFYKYDILIDKSCKFFIEDLKFVESDSTGQIDKGKDKHLTHLLDCGRYQINTLRIAELC